MKYIFLLGGMSLFSGIAFSQQQVSNQREMVAAPAPKEVPASGNSTEGTLTVQPVERAMNAANTAEQSGQEKKEAANVNPSEQLLVNPTERTAISPEKPISNSTKKPD